MEDLLLQTKLQLVNFQSVWQLVACICLLFFYDDILRKVVPTAKRQKCIEHYNEIRHHLQVQFSQRDALDLRRLIDCEQDSEGKWHSLTHYRDAVSFIGRLGFIFFVGLMLVASHEDTATTTDNSSYGWIIIAGIIFLVISFMVLKYRAKGWYKKSEVYNDCCALIAIPLFLCLICPIEWWPYTNKFAIYFILVIMLVVVVMTIKLFTYDEKRVDLVCRDLKLIKEEVVAYGEWAVDPNNAQLYRNMQTPIKLLFRINSDLDNAQQKVDRYVDGRFDAMISNYEFKRYCIINPLYRIMNIKDNIVSKLCRYSELIFIEIILLCYISLCVYGLMHT